MAPITLVHDCDIERRDVPAATGGDFRDTTLCENGPPYVPEDSDWLSAGVCYGEGGKSENVRRDHLIVRIDLNAFIPAGASITAAEWVFYVYSTGAQAGHNFYAYRLVTTDWVEDEATWTVYKTGSNWPQAGGDPTTPDIDWGTVTTSGWKSKDLTAIVQDAWDNRSKVLNFLVRCDAPLTIAGRFTTFPKERYGGPYSDRIHHVRITYTLEGRTFQAMVR